MDSSDPTRPILPLEYAPEPATLQIEQDADRVRVVIPPLAAWRRPSLRMILLAAGLVVGPIAVHGTGVGFRDWFGLVMTGSLTVSLLVAVMHFLSIVRTELRTVTVETDGRTIRLAAGGDANVQQWSREQVRDVTLRRRWLGRDSALMLRLRYDQSVRIAVHDHDALVPVARALRQRLGLETT